MSSDCFVAVPVGKGDAFFFEYQGARYLVDGGQAVQGFSETLKATTGADSLDVVVCTHADADHANGVLGLLKVGAIPVREVWLPGRWTERLPDLLAEPLKFYAEVAEECRGADHDDLEAFAEATSGPVSGEESDPDRGRDDADSHEGSSLEPLRNLIVEAPELPRWPRPSALYWEIVDVLWEVPEPHRRRIFLQAVDAAERIRDIARWAVDRGAEIKWFDFDQFERSGKPIGGNTVLRPVNSVELLLLPKRRKLSALRYLALTVANRESLVFLGRPGAPGESRELLFTADSDLGFDLPEPPPRSLIATAPHHGAESNAQVYGKVGDWMKSANISWVRSDSACKKRPGSAFRTAPGKKFCTLCNPPKRPKARIVLRLEVADCDSDVAACSCGGPT